MVPELDIPPIGGVVGLMTVTWAVPGAAMSVEGTVALSWPLPRYAVGRLLPFHCTTEAGTNPEPPTRRVKPAEPGATMAGDRSAMTGTGVPTSNGSALDMPPPGPGVRTVTWAVLGAATSLDGIIAVSCVGLTKVVVRLLPFHWTTELATNPLPATASEKVPATGTVEEGDREVRIGAGLLMVKIRPFEVPPAGAGLTTVTWTVPAVAMSLAGIAACKIALLPKPVVRLEPFNCTTEPEVKPVPFTVRVKSAAPAVAVAGEMEVRLGIGVPIKRERALETPPPGGPLETVTWTVPIAAMSLAGIAAVIWVLLKKVVKRLLPFHCTTELSPNPVPATVRLKPAPPAGVMEGEMELIEGTGFGGGWLAPPPPHAVKQNIAASRVTRQSAGVADTLSELNRGSRSLERAEHIPKLAFELLCMRNAAPGTAVPRYIHQALVSTKKTKRPCVICRQSGYLPDRIAAKDELES